jgi:hypothetical protein
VTFRRNDEHSLQLIFYEADFYFEDEANDLRQIIILGCSLALICSIFHPSKHEVRLDNIKKLVYLAKDTLRLHYKGQLVNTVQVNNRCLFLESCETHKYTLLRRIYSSQKCKHSNHCTLNC